MNQYFKKKGVWSCAKGKKSINGELEFDPGYGITLNLDDYFEDKEETSMEKIDFLNGIANDGKYFTLFNCHVLSRGFSSDKGKFSVINASLLFEGYHFTEIEEIAFHKCSVGYSHFGKWYGQTGFKPITKKSGLEYAIGFKHPDCPKFVIDDGTIASFNSFFSASLPSNGRVGLSEEYSFTISYGSLRPWSEINSDILCFQAFLKLCHYAEVSITSITLTNLNIKYQMESVTVSAPIRVYYAHKSLTHNKKEYLMRGLFEYAEIAASFETIIQKLYILNRQVPALIAFLSDSFSTINQSIQNSFLDIARAVEVFHRELRDSPKMSQEIKDKIAKLCRQFPEDAAWIKEKLAYCHQPTLQQRINLLLAEIPNPLLFQLSKNSNDFSKHIVFARNYLTHRAEKEKPKFETDPETLLLLRNKLRFVLLILMLRELGIDDALIEKKISAFKPMYFYWLGD